MLNKLAFVLLLMTTLSWAAEAATLNEVETLYNDGHFHQTIEEGRKLGTIEGLNFAVRAQLILVQYVFDVELRTAAIDRAVIDARKAHELDPDNLEATINLGIIIGLRGKYARSIPDGKECRDLFQKAVEMDPSSSWALGAFASWNSDTVDQAGGIAARLIFGAKKKVAWEFFEKAVTAEPGNLTIRAAFVRALLKLKPKKFAETIDENMAYILGEPADNALEAIMQKQIREIQKARAENNEERLKLLLDEMVALEPRPKKQ